MADLQSQNLIIFMAEVHFEIQIGIVSRELYG